MNTRIEHKCPLSKNAHIYTPSPHPHPRVYDIIYHALQGSCNFWVLINEIEIDVFSTKVLIEDTILSLLLETGPPFYVVIRATRIKVWPFAGLRQSTGLSIGLAPGIEPGSSRSTGKRSTDLTEIFFLTKAYRHIDRGHHLLYFNLSTSPLESFFDSPQLSVSFNVQDGGRTFFIVSSFTLQNTPDLQATYWANPILGCDVCLIVPSVIIGNAEATSRNRHS